jgi:hypothetical protein
VWDGSDPVTRDGTNYFDLVDHVDDPDFDPDVGTIDSISSFGEDTDGNLYILDLGGEVFLVPEPENVWLSLTGLATVFFIVTGRRPPASTSARIHKGPIAPVSPLVLLSTPRASIPEAG